MRPILSILLFSLLFCGTNTVGNDYPDRWRTYSSNRYIYAIEEDDNDSGVSQSTFINELLNRARLNVAKQLNISISDKAEIVKKSLNGVSAVNYSAKTSFSTDATLRLLRTDTEYTGQKGFALAYLDKEELSEYWAKEADRVILELETILEKAEEMISFGYKKQAKHTLGEAPSKYYKINEPLIWLSLCSFPQDKYQAIVDKYAKTTKDINSLLLSLGHGVTIYLKYSSDLFGSEYPATVNQLSSMLSSEDRSFVNTPQGADWIITIDAIAKEGQKTALGDKTAFFSNVDISMSIVKGKTSQVIYKDFFSIKEGNTRGYKEAAYTAYKKVASTLYGPIMQNITE